MGEEKTVLWAASADPLKEALSFGHGCSNHIIVKDTLLLVDSLAICDVLEYLDVARIVISLNFALILVTYFHSFLDYK